ncbi:metal-dependent hydrolase [Massilia rubra]|nr:metal-dependent hydrolase [Massilia rubra]
MPFTPFHLGPGAAMKAIGGRHFSFMVFGGAQVLMDLEPLVRLIAGSSIVHGPTHSVPGALLVGAVAALTGKPVSEFVLRLVRAPDQSISWFASCMGAFLGTFSHVVLDAIMHSDTEPWWPLSSANPFLGLVSVRALHLACLLGVALWLVVDTWRQFRKRRNGGAADHQ